VQPGGQWTGGNTEQNQHRRHDSPGEFPPTLNQGNWQNRHGYDRDRGRAGFAPFVMFGPPEGMGWGYRNRERWDPDSFRSYDPNYQNWAPSINQEAGVITDLLNQAETNPQATTQAAEVLNQDLWTMKNDVYAQNELLSEINQEQNRQSGAYLYLNNWNPDRGTWDTVDVVTPRDQPAITYHLRDPNS
jgi:hypothetical protein